MSDTVRVGLNGFGRIGRTVFRAALDDDRVEIVGINDAMSEEDVEYLAKYDTVMGRLEGVELDDGELVVEDADFSAPVYNEMSPSALPWDGLDVDAASRRGIVVCNTPGANARSVAEHAVALLFAVRRSLRTADRHVRTGA